MQHTFVVKGQSRRTVDGVRDRCAPAVTVETTDPPRAPFRHIQRALFVVDHAHRRLNARDDSFAFRSERRTVRYAHEATTQGSGNQKSFCMHKVSFFSWIQRLPGFASYSFCDTFSV